MLVSRALLTMPLQGECWLKWTHGGGAPHVNRQGAYDEAFRNNHRTAPYWVPWVSGRIHLTREQLQPMREA